MRRWPSATPRMGDCDMGLWRLPTSYEPARAEVLDALPKLKPPMLSLIKANRNKKGVW